MGPKAHVLPRASLSTSAKVPRIFPSRAVAVMLLSSCVASQALARPCGPPPPAVKDLDVTRFYGDDVGSIIDPRLAEEHKKAVQPLTAFLRVVTAEADKALREGSSSHAACALEWISAWARGDAWLGKMGTKQAEYQRKWDLAGVSLAYLKLRPFADPGTRAIVEPWLIRFADAAHAFFDDPTRKRNNHWYWLGLGLAATALATDSNRHWELARGIMGDAANDIAANGTLPMELEREARALHYHAFALTALVALAELGNLRGEDWYALNSGALHRLVAVTSAGLQNPDVFDTLAHHTQERPVNPGSGWIELYGRRFPGRVIGATPSAPKSHRWLGGDVEALSLTLVALERSRAAKKVP